ncbi:MAG TPA: ABC transporter permease [Symbiobacteriaceae bacterium]|nr:ABC transporter permease [Symbiobacteriaceae bacterium]
MAAAKVQELETRTTPQWVTVLRRLAKHKAAMAGLVILVMLVVLAVLAPAIAPYSPTDGDFASYLQPPGGAHWMGTDDQGRDVFTRVLFGLRLSLVVGLISVSIGAVVGVTLGALAGFKGGWLDNAVMRVMDILLAFPIMLLALAIVIGLGQGLDKAIIAVGIVSIPQYARITRGAVIQVRENDYVQAARATGATELRALLKHIMPNIFAPLLVRATLGTSEAVLETAGLSFLGLGAKLPTPELGLMIARSREHFYDAPYLIYFPGLAITLMILALNLLGDGLRDALDPRLKR